MEADEEMGIDETSALHIISKETSNPKLEIDLSIAAEGMLMAETVHNNMGAIIILENTVLDSGTIKRLKMLGIKKVKVYQKIHDVGSRDNVQHFREMYVQQRAIVKEVFNDVFSGKPLNMGKISQVSESIRNSGNADGACLKITERLQNFSENLYSHSINVSMLSFLIAKWLKLEEARVDVLIKAGLLHDIGKTKINPAILNKYDPLAEPANEEVKNHPAYGCELIPDTGYVENYLAEAILMHHEREDGSGYPSGYKAHEINPLSKIIAVADLFDRLTSGTVSRKGLPPFDAFEVMQSESFNRYNMEIVLKFLENAHNYFIGERFFLSNDEVGEVIFINPKMVHRPLIKIEERYIDLANDRSIRLESMI